ncbi:hypothetical protein DaDZ19_04320 [Dickeya ananatis]
MADYCDEQGGFIIRTAAEGVGEEELAQDAAFLKRLWTKVMERKKTQPDQVQIIWRTGAGTPYFAGFCRCIAGSHPR